ncbi:phosphohydrolase [Candidatus Shapirobacteria bacterium CG09_land_8_20_14_0_10_38_17]|uniref:Phosphohydrolase n=1 Tax=Candidatus Shapirobacteria bacterium CG09_land_8_20_14_0_10_38_17 TaxID=1974884 RepID=A0A2H0WRL5_9BACT|nr:MAG: phosphohydrolase [Candidatus Shapirobacteria bacterium CG09_land_8_20_14_0_10_38_17]
MDRDKILTIINQYIDNKNIVKHMLAMEAFMRALAKKLGGDENEWGITGLVHDLDYIDSTPANKHGLLVGEMLEKEGVILSPEILSAVAAHNWHNNGVEPKSLMDWALFCGDSLTGLIVACTLVLPSKKLADLTVKSILKKFPQKRFAAGTRREDIKMGEEKLDIPLEEFVDICLKAMQGINKELGL